MSPEPTATTAPLPAIAKGPDIPSRGYLRQEIEDGLHLVTEGVYQMMFFATDDGVVAVDAPPSLGGYILPAIAEVTSSPVTHVVYSHHHADHIGAAAIYPVEAVRWAHRDTAALLTRLADANRPVPSRVLETSHVLRVGEQVLHLDYHGPNHSPGNLFVYAPRQRTLMLVDVVFPGWVPFDSLGQSSDIPGWVDAHDQALAYDFDTFVGGHVTRPGTRADVRTQQEYVADLRTAVETARKGLDVPALRAGLSDPTNPWAFVNACNEAVADVAAGDVTARWIDRLGGADVYTRSNVLTMAEAMLIDYGQNHR